MKIIERYYQENYIDLCKGENGHYLEQQRNRSGCHVSRVKCSNSFAQKVIDESDGYKQFEMMMEYYCNNI